LAAAASIDLYLAWASGSAGPIAGCGPASNCHTVLASKWAYWFGVPVSLPALLVYAGLFLTTFWLEAQTPDRQRRRAWAIVAFGSITILGAALWFIGLQLFILKRLCPYCLATHLSACLAAVLLLRQFLLQATPLPSAKDKSSPASDTAPLLKLSLGAAALLAILAGGQVLQSPKTFTTNTVVAGKTPNPVAPHFQIFSGKFQFDLGEVPLIGRSNAPCVIVSLYDYSCHNCRDMHGPLLEAYQRFSNQLAIVSLPMPLDGKCNPVMRYTPPPHTNACELARLGLAVWRANRSVMRQFDDWMFSSPVAPKPDAARAFARQLVGAEALDQASNDPWVEQQLHQDISIFDTAYRQFGKGYMPQVIIGTNLFSGTFGREQLFRALSNQFGLKM
jgi:uncharacterized membrane protein/protein-disulfide isomerase